MKMIFILFILSIKVFATVNTTIDSVLSKKIIGLWYTEFKSKNKYLYGEKLYKSDGTVIGNGEICHFEKCKKIHFISNWKINKNILSSITIYSNMEHVFAIGSEDTDKIVSITNKKITIISNYTGNKIIYKKIEKSKFD